MAGAGLRIGEVAVGGGTDPGRPVAGCRTGGMTAMGWAGGGGATPAPVVGAAGTVRGWLKGTAVPAANGSCAGTG